MLNIKNKKLITNILLIMLLLTLASCNNENKEIVSKDFKKIENLKKLNLILKIKPFKDKIVYRHIENGKDTFINILDRNIKKTTKINIDFLKENLLDKKSYNILSGFSLNNNNYLYVTVWKNDKQIDGYWLKFGKNIDKNYKKLKFKGFSYNMNILSNDLVMIGNKLINLKESL